LKAIHLVEEVFCDSRVASVLLRRPEVVVVVDPEKAQ
jgi:hypothetical protein